MRRWSTAWLGCSAILACGLTACVSPEQASRLNAPPQGDSEDRHAMAEYFAYHNDQGMVADMSIADIHFVPHSDRLSGTGEARLERYAELLAATGGTLSYETNLQDENLIEARIANAELFLAQANPGKTTIEVAVGLPGGRGMPATEAIAGQEVARQPEPRDTAYKLRDSTGSTTGN